MAESLHDALRSAWAAFIPLIADGRLEERGGYRIVSVPSFPVPSANAVWVDGPEDEGMIRDLETSLGEIRARGVAPSVITMEGRAPRVGSEATRLGLTRAESFPGMVATPESFRPPEDRPAELVRVGSDEELLGAALSVTAASFEAPPDLFRSLFDGAMRDPLMDLWLALVDGEPVSTAVGVVAGGAVGIYDVGTPPQHRGRGYGGLVTAQVVRRGFEAGASFAYLQATELGFGVYRRLGFEQVSTYRLLRHPEPPA